MNRVILIGNLTRDPEHTTTASGVSMCRFGLAVNRRFSRGGDNEVDFFNVVAWRGVADSCAKSLTKGRKVCVVGSIQIRNYEGQDGKQRTSVEVSADEVEFLGSRNSEEGAPSGGYSARKEDAPAPKLERIDSSEEDLPF